MTEGFTAEEIKQILRQGRNLEKRIRMLEESRERAYARVTSATQQFSVTGVRSDSEKDAMAEYVAYSEEIVSEIAKLERMQRNILRLVKRVRRHDYQNLLHLYYIDCLTWEEVAVKMNYSWRWVMKLHGKALVEAARIASRERNVWEQYSLRRK